jgi:ribokinase
MKTTFDVICLGAALVDMVAQVERHPLDDDEVFVSDLKLLSGGAAANTAYSCAKIGLSSAFLGKLGKNDVFGAKIIEDFNEVNVNTTLIKYSKQYGTGSAYVALNKEGDRRIYAHSGAANYLSKEDVIEKELKASKIIFLSSLKNIEPFIEAAKIGEKNNITVILNPGMLIIDQGLENISELLKKIDILILSQREFRTLLNLKDRLDDEIIRDKAKILLEYGMKTLIITMGDKGAFLLTNKKSELIPAMKIEQVTDTTGAGDAFSAGFIYGFAQNLSFEFKDLKKNVIIGNFVAGKCIQELGARKGIPTSEELKQII